MKIKDSDKKEIRDLTTYKSNTLITSKYSMNARSMKILTAGLTKIDPFGVPPKNGTSVNLTPQELRELLNTKSHSLYEQMKDVKDNIGSNNTIFYEDDKNQRTGFFVLVESCDFDTEKGITINFGKTATPFLYELQKSSAGFTKLKVSTILGLTSSYSIRLYELFKKIMFRMSNNMPYLEVEYGLNELKFILGLIDLNSKEAKKCREMMRDGETDYDKIIEVFEGDIPYKRIDNFRRKVLDIAMRELEAQTEIRFEYDTVRKGRWVNAIRFRIYRNIPDNDEFKESLKKLEQLETIEEEDVIDFIISMIEEKKVKIAEARQIAIAGEYNINYISKAYQLFKQQKNVSNICGWMVACLNNNYENIKEINAEFEEIIK